MCSYTGTKLIALILLFSIYTIFYSNLVSCTLFSHMEESMSLQIDMGRAQLMMQWQLKKKKKQGFADFFPHLVADVVVNPHSEKQF